MTSALRLAPVALSVLAFSAVATASVQTFDDPITLSNTPGDGVWYTDRYAPAGFESGVFFDGDNRLRQTISAADGAANRSNSFSGAFYNTQGRKFNNAAGTTSVSIDLYVDSSWETSGRRMAGIWGTATDNADAISGYPIVEYYSNGTTGGFRAWSSEAPGIWYELGLPTGFSYDSWSTLTISLVGSNWVCSVGDASVSFDALGSTSIINTILQGHNTTEGVDYDIYWDNMTTVPAPGAVALLGLAGLAGSRRRRN